MDKMSDSRAVEVLDRLALGADEPDVHAALARAIARLREPAEAQRCTCPSGDGSLRWPCPAHPPEAQAQAQGGGAIICPECHGTGGHYWHEADGSERGERCATCYGFGYYTAPPSAPVGVEAAAREVIESINRFRDAGTRPGDGTLVHWEATLHRALAQQPAACKACGGRGEVGGLTLDGYESHPCPECEEQPAAVDGECAHCVGGIVPMTFDRPCAHCRGTGIAVQPGGSDNDR